MASLAFRLYKIQFRPEQRPGRSDGPRCGSLRCYSRPMLGMGIPLPIPYPSTPNLYYFGILLSAPRSFQVLNRGCAAAVACNEVRDVSAEVGAVTEALTTTLEDVLSHGVDVGVLMTTSTTQWPCVVVVDGGLKTVQDVHCVQHVEQRVQTRQKPVVLHAQIVVALACHRICDDTGTHTVSKTPSARKQKKTTKNKKYAQRAQTSADPEDPDFGLWTQGSEAWSGSPPKLYHLVLEPCPTPPKLSSKSVHKFASNPTDRQTNRQTNRRTNRQTDRTKNITSFFGGGNYYDYAECNWEKRCD